MLKPVILTGIRANNDLHIGNYFGAMLPLIDMAKARSKDYQVSMFVPDLHSFISPIDHSKFYETIMNNLRVFVAAGIPLNDPDIHLYRHSFITAHSELAWILDCFTGMGEMNRMTQYKDKAGLASIDDDQLIDLNYYETKAKQALLTQVEIDKLIKHLRLRDEYRLKNYAQKDRVSVGIFTYPILMAADILLYGAKYVPVGDDQSQHIEFTRNIAERMNAKFGNLFVVPEPVKKQHEFFGKDQGLRIKDLVDPTKKMSKSDETGKGVIFLSDTPEVARKKIMGATTDSLQKIQRDYDSQPGVSNLLDILELFGENPKDLIGNTQYGVLKSAVADAACSFLQSFQTRLASVDNEALNTKLLASESIMRTQANAVLLATQKAVGLR